MKSSNMLKLSVVAAISLVASQMALAQGVGNPGQLPNIIPMNNPGGWDIWSSAGTPLPVQRDPNGPKWPKHLTDPTGGPITASWGTVFNVHEMLVIAPNLSWSDWHEDILTPGWGWTNNISFLANFLPTPGLSITNTPSTFTQGGSLSFLFSSLPPGTVIDIRKELVYQGNPGAIFQGSIDLLQYPTPEPATLALLGLGGAAMLMRRKQASAL